MGNLCYYRIGYCPFCGQKININIAREEDRSADYSTMSTLRGLLKERIKSTDDDIEKEFHLAVDDYIQFKREISRDD